MKTSIATMRKHARKGAETIDTGKQNGEPVFYYFGELLPEQWCDEVARSINHTGWFTNPDGETYRDGSGKARGIVVTLPVRPSFPDGVFLAGYVYGDSGERVVWPDCFNDADDCARTADGYAETFAEKEREHSIKWQEARDVENENENALQRLRECIALRNRACMDYIRDEIRELCETIRTNRVRLAGEFADYV